MPSIARILKMARNAISAWTEHEADLSGDAEAKAVELIASVAAYDKANGEQEVMKAALLKKTAEVNALGELVGKQRADLARLVDVKLPRSDERRKLFRNDK
jgi:hypothetical protein